MAHVRGRPPLLRWLSGLLVSVALVAAVSGLLALLEPYVPVRSLLVLYLLAVLPVAVVWGVELAVAVSVASTAVFALLFLPPLYPVLLADPGDAIALGVFLITSVVVGELAARSRRRALESARLTEEQAALRRVATLVAQATPRSEVFEAVLREVALLSGADLARLERYEADGTVMGVAGWSRVPARLAVGSRFTLDGLSIAGQVRQTGGAVRVNSFTRAGGDIAREARNLGIRSSVGCPIIVAGRLWGVIAASSSAGPFPANTESQIADFTEVVATAIANAESRAEITTLVEDLAARGRVATLVARGMPADEVFAAAVDDVGRALRADATIIVRLDPDGLATVVARIGGNPHDVSVGSRVELEPPVALAEVLRTGRPCRHDDDSPASGAFVDLVHGVGIQSVATPIVVGGRTWGALGVGTRDERFPLDTEQRMAGFAELVAIAVGNAQSRVELAASRARVVVASDEARRRIERDLHDGVQQRLVTMGLEMRLAQNSVPLELGEVRSGIGRIVDELTGALDELREMSRGIHPAILSEGGLAPALRALARRSAIPVEVDVRTGVRFPEAVEVAAYFVVSEALANTAKHARASYATVAVQELDGAMQVSVCDDGVGGAQPLRGSGLVGLRDRVEALGGLLEIRSPPGDGTQVQVTLPPQPS